MNCVWCNAHGYPRPGGQIIWRVNYTNATCNHEPLPLTRDDCTRQIISAHHGHIVYCQCGHHIGERPTS